MTQPSDAPAFSRPTPVERLPDRGRTVKLAAEPPERAALAALFDLVSLDALEATLTLRPAAGGERVVVSGTVSARLAQRCVVTLTPVPAEVSCVIERTFAFSGAWNDEGGDMDLDPDAEEPPDPVVDGKIDLGDVVAEELALALDPYPRAPGAVYEPAPEDEAERSSAHPFAALAALRSGGTGETGGQ